MLENIQTIFAILIVILVIPIYFFTFAIGIFFNAFVCGFKEGKTYLERVYG